MSSLTLEQRREFNRHVRAAKAAEASAAEVGSPTVARQFLASALEAYRAASFIDTTNKKLNKKVHKLSLKLGGQQASPAPASSPPAATAEVEAPQARLSPGGRENVPSPGALLWETQAPPRTPKSLPKVPPPPPGALRTALSPISPRPVEDSAGSTLRVVSRALHTPKADSPQPVLRTRGGTSPSDACGAVIKAEAADGSPHGWEYSAQDDAFHLPGGFAVPAGCFMKLYPHQREGVAWMWGLHPASSSPPVFSAFGVDLIGDARGTLARAGVRQVQGGALCPLSPGASPQDTPSSPSSHPAVSREDVFPLPHTIRARGGGILGDDMGLGKTVQVSAFIGALLQTPHAHAVLVVAPTSIIPTWQSELAVWAAGVHVSVYSGTKAERRRALATTQRLGGVLLTTYGMVTHNAEDLRSIAPVKGRGASRRAPAASSVWGKALAGVRAGAGHAAHGEPEHGSEAAPGQFMWSAVVCDEGHKIKNTSTKIAKALRCVQAQYRLLLTGTPLQNHMEELWSLFDYATQGQLLGRRQVFNAEFANVILASRERGASQRVRERGTVAAALLRARIAPHFLRREKGVGGTPRKPSAAAGGGSPLPSLTPGLHATKTEVVVWTTLAPLQETLYSSFLTSAAVKRVLNESGSPLAALSILKKVCNSPLLLGERERGRVIAALLQRTDEYEDATPEDLEALVRDLAQNGHASHIAAGAEPDVAATAVQLAGLTARRDVSALVACSAKLQFLQRLLPTLQEERARTLIFSGSKVMLNVVGSMLRQSGTSFLRIDGDVADPAERRRIVDTFNTDASVDVCLLTTGVGSLGLTLTGASRVVILDPHWNPSVDAQAVDRAYRIGQTRDVITYRLITCGTVEEKQYRLQVFKGGVTQSVLGHGAGADSSQGAPDSGYKRYLTRSELRAMFSLGSTQHSETVDMLAEAAGPAPAPKPGSEPDKHLRVLTGPSFQASLVQVSRHDHLYRLGEAAAAALAERLRTVCTPATSRKMSRTEHLVRSVPRAAVHSDLDDTPTSQASSWQASPAAPGEVAAVPSPANSEETGASPGFEQSPLHGTTLWKARPASGDEDDLHEVDVVVEDDVSVGEPAGDDAPTDGHGAAGAVPGPEGAGIAGVASVAEADGTSGGDALTKAADAAVDEVRGMEASLGLRLPAGSCVKALADHWLEGLQGGSLSMQQGRTYTKQCQSAAQAIHAALGVEGHATYLPFVQRAEAAKSALIRFATQGL